MHWRIKPISKSISNLDERVAELNGNVSIHTIAESSSLSGLQTALETFANGMANTTVKNIKFGLSSPTAPLSATTYFGTITRSSSTRFIVVAHGTSTERQDIVGLYNSGTWKWNSINSNISNKITVSSVLTTDTIPVNGATDWANFETDDIVCLPVIVQGDVDSSKLAIGVTLAARKWRIVNGASLGQYATYFLIHFKQT